MALKSYHFAWLEAHPHRTEEWLQCALDDGFDIHHLDGDHGNDAIDNLVLIESLDHIRLHGGNKIRSYKNGLLVGRAAMADERGRVSYERRLAGELWPAIGRDLYPDVWRNHQAGRAIESAKRYASRSKLPWPVRSSEIADCR